MKLPSNSNEVLDVMKKYCEEKKFSFYKRKDSTAFGNVAGNNFDISLGVGESALFEVNGVYSLSGTLMITGFVETGRLKRNMKTIVNENLVRIDEVRENRERVPSLFKGEQGTLVIKSKNNPLIRSGDFLEFE